MNPLGVWVRYLCVRGVQFFSSASACFLNPDSYHKLDLVLQALDCDKFLPALPRMAWIHEISILNQCNYSLHYCNQRIHRGLIIFESTSLFPKVGNAGWCLHSWLHQPQISVVTSKVDPPAASLLLASPIRTDPRIRLFSDPSCSPIHVGPPPQAGPPSPFGFCFSQQVNQLLAPIPAIGHYRPGSPYSCRPNRKCMSP